MDPSYVAHVLNVRQYFAGVGVWESSLTMRPRQWIENFDPDDQLLAAHLLDGFVFLNHVMVNKLFETGFQRLSFPHLNEIDAATALSSWRRLRDHALVSYPTTNPTDSGHLFLRLIRDRFSIDESRIYTLPDLTAALREMRSPVPIVLVDDFSGTGDQFVRSITRPHESVLLHEIERLGVTDAYFVVAVITAKAKERIESSTPFTVSAGTVLPESASLLSNQSHVVAAESRESVKDLVHHYSNRLGIPPSDAWGYKRSALAISFAHKTPNNTIPLFTHKNGWTPLVTN